MIHILARNDHSAKAFANGKPYKLATEPKHLFNATTIHVMFDWQSNKSACTLKKMRALLLLHELSPLCKVVRHDILL